MKILFLHQNFPGQFLHLGPALKAKGHEVLALTRAANQRPSPVPVIRYRWDDGRHLDRNVFKLATTYMEMSDRGGTVAAACAAMRDKNGYEPDVVFGHMGWGETLFVKEIWPRTKLLAYAEFFYRRSGLDTDFDPEFRSNDWNGDVWRSSREAHLLHALYSADKLLAPTRFQASTFPENYQSRMSVIHDGIDTDAVSPSDKAVAQLPGTNIKFNKGDEVLTFINRNLEPYRGYHIFMRALPEIMKARPNVQVVLIGDNNVSYGPRAPGGKSWKEIFLDEVKDRIDLSRVHFPGPVPYQTFVALMRVTRVHAYLTYPFVLSWSMLEAMSAGALVIGSNTPPVQELIQHGENGMLVDFFDVKAWSDAVIEALASPQKYDAIRHAARDTILNGYDLRRICLPRMIEFVEGR